MKMVMGIGLQQEGMHHVLIESPPPPPFVLLSIIFVREVKILVFQKMC